MVSLNSVTIKHRNTTVFEKIDFHVGSGEFVFLIGKTGSGKSTLIDIISGLINFQKGQMIVDENMIPISFWMKDALLEMRLEDKEIAQDITNQRDFFLSNTKFFFYEFLIKFNRKTK